MDILISLWENTGFSHVTLGMVLMWLVVVVLLWLAVAKNFEPLLLVPIAFGALLANLPTVGVMEGLVDLGFPFAVNDDGTVSEVGGLFYYFYQGIHLELFPPLIFLGVGALTDFGPLIANPRVLLLGGAAQFGVFATLFGAVAIGFAPTEAAAIGIIGGADGPTSIFLANKLAPHLLAPIAVAAYTYMALVPLIQPPIMRLLTTKTERVIKMRTLRKVGKTEKLIFAVMVMMVCILLAPGAAALLFMLFLGNFMRECGVVERLSRTAQNELINIVTILLGVSVGITMTADRFLALETMKIIAMGIVAFGVSTAAGVLMAKLMNLFSKTKINPLIGSAGVSAVPMAARVSQVEGAKYDKSNFLLMHAMGPNVAGVIGTALVAGYFISVFE